VYGRCEGASLGLDSRGGSRGGDLEGDVGIGGTGMGGFWGRGKGVGKGKGKRGFFEGSGKGEGGRGWDGGEVRFGIWDLGSGIWNLLVVGVWGCGFGGLGVVGVVRRVG